VLHLTAQGPRTPTVTLVGLVGAQLGQTITMAPNDPRVLAASLGTAATMGLIIMTPGVSQLFGCRPLGPLGWSVGLGGAALGTAVAAVIPRVITAARRDKDAAPGPLRLVAAPAPAD
jgi:hypothetical protein